MAAKRSYGGPGRFQYVKWAIAVFHRNGFNAGLVYLKQGFERKGFKGPVGPYFDEYRTYCELYWSRPFPVIRVAENIDVPLGLGLVMGGSVGRTELTPNGYAVWLITEQLPPKWQTELRIPLLQSYYAKEFGASSSEVSVGFIALRSGLQESIICSEALIQDAWQEVSDIAAILASP